MLKDLYENLIESVNKRVVKVFYSSFHLSGDGGIVILLLLSLSLYTVNRVSDISYEMDDVDRTNLKIKF